MQKRDFSSGSLLTGQRESSGSEFYVRRKRLIIDGFLIKILLNFNCNCLSELSDKSEICEEECNKNIFHFKKIKDEI